MGAFDIEYKMGIGDLNSSTKFLYLLGAVCSSNEECVSP